MADDIPVNTVLMGATQALSLFLALAPKPNEVRRTSLNDADAAHDLRRSELIAGGVGISVATYVTIHTRSATPLIVSGLGILALIAIYEYQLRQPHSKTANVVNPHSEYTAVPITDIQESAA